MKQKRNIHVFPDSTSDAVGTDKAGARRRKNLYTSDEDFKLLQYVRDQLEENNEEIYLGGNKFWKRMERKSVLPGRTWMSMRDRYLKKLQRKRLPLKGVQRSRDEAESLAPFNRRMIREKCKILLSQEGPCTSTTCRDRNRSNSPAPNLQLRSVNGDDNQASRSDSADENTDAASLSNRSGPNLRITRRKSVHGDDSEASRSGSTDENEDATNPTIRGNIRGPNLSITRRKSVNGDDNQASRSRSSEKDMGLSSSPIRGNRPGPHLRITRRRSVDGDENQASRSYSSDENTDAPSSSVRGNGRRSNLRITRRRSVKGDDNQASRSRSSDKNTDTSSSIIQRNSRRPNLRRSLLKSDDNSTSSADENTCKPSASLPCKKIAAISPNLLENVVEISSDDEGKDGDDKLLTTFYQGANDDRGTETSGDEEKLRSVKLEDAGDTSFNGDNGGGTMSTAGEQTLGEEEDVVHSSSEKLEDFDKKLLEMAAKDPYLMSPEEVKVVRMVKEMRQKTKATLPQIFFSLFRTSASLEHATAFLKDQDTTNVWRLDEDKVLMEKDEEKIRTIIKKRGCCAVEKRLDFIESYSSESENESESVTQEDHKVME